ncbi:MAG: rod shape-determining protein RodA [Calditrichaeota bacterium]|nr:MAG: rod shape-determining protein RodA [Calditrichota bacterium]
MVNRWIRSIDWLILLPVLGLLAIGCVALYSSSHSFQSMGHQPNYFSAQLLWVALGLVGMTILSLVPPRWIQSLSPHLYVLSVLLLGAVLVIGSTGMGATRWLKIGPLRLQPSELAKLATLLALARYLSRPRVDVNRPRDFLLASSLLLLPFLLVVRQPDLGTALVFAAMALPVYYWSGLKSGNLFLILFPGLVMLASFNFYAFLVVMAALFIYLLASRRSMALISFNFLLNVFIGLLTPVLWNHLKPYQQQRIRIFLRPEMDPLGAGYQIIQSKVAIGSGGLWGKGFMQGSQTQLRFLPEQHTDFIFAVIGEEFGFIGAVLTLLLFALLLLRITQFASQCRNPFFSLVSIGIGTIFTFHVLVNIGMTLGFLPVTGLPLPFISYGGSAMLTNLAMIGLLLNFYRHRFEAG